jgi:Cu(I)/Ag(I) efflux system membrane fusion protein
MSILSANLIKKGQPLFTLYSPDLVSTQEEYLIAKRGNATLGNAPFQEIAEGSQSLLQSARQRLKLWDISDEQIKELDTTGKVSKYLTFYSPITGFVTDRKAFPQTSVTPDTELYTVSDLSTVWADADIYEYEVPFRSSWPASLSDPELLPRQDLHRKDLIHLSDSRSADANRQGPDTDSESRFCA